LDNKFGTNSANTQGGCGKVFLVTFELDILQLLIKLSDHRLSGFFFFIFHGPVDLELEPDWNDGQATNQGGDCEWEPRADMFPQL
jgi:hypothetical protein